VYGGGINLSTYQRNISAQHVNGAVAAVRHGKSMAAGGRQNLKENSWWRNGQWQKMMVRRAVEGRA